MADTESSVQEQLALLKASFGSNLTERFGEIRDAAAPLTQPTANADETARAIDTLQALAHKLTGSAGTFGFAKVSQVARTLETKSGELKDASISEEDRATLLKRVAELEAAISESDDAAAEDSVQLPTASAPVSSKDEELAVLYLGDVADASGMLADRLAEFGFQVRHVSRKEASAVWDPETFAVAIVDLDSAEWRDAPTDEIESAARLGNGSIAISSDQSFDRRLSAVRFGFASFLPTPLEVTAVVAAIDRNLTARTPDPYRILIIDDDMSLAKYVEVVLGGAGMITESITDPFVAMDTIREFCPELILLDLNMPGCSGAELASVIRQQDSLSSVSIVFLSSESDPSRQIAAMHTGGDDFLPKSLRAEHLVSAVEARANRFRQLRSMLVSDSLTGLLNHTATKHQIEVEIGRAKREQSLFCLVLIDIDHFKAVNDTYGHSCGDQVIRSLALLLKQRFRSTDVIGRLGGEEFGLVLSGTGREDALRIVNEVRETFAAMRFETDTGSFSATFSAGISSFPEQETVKALSDVADHGLYASKDAGRNRVEFGD